MEGTAPERLSLCPGGQRGRGQHERRMPGELDPCRVLQMWQGVEGSGEVPLCVELVVICSGLDLRVSL